MVSAGCTHDPAELIEDVNTTIFVVGLEDRELARVEVAGEVRQAAPERSGEDGEDDDVVMFQLALPQGEHDGEATVLRREDGELEPRRCGGFHVSLPDAGSADSVVIDAEDLEECSEGEEGEGEEGEGEGEEGEGEGEGDDDDRTPPVLAQPPEQRVLVGGVVVVTLSATDDVSAADRIAFTIETGPQHGNASLSGNVLSYQASDSSDDNDVVRVRATDEAGNASAIVDVQLEVQGFASCQGIGASGLAAGDGAYALRVVDDGEQATFVPHHCVFVGGEGWTLAVKAEGDDPRIAFDADWQGMELDDGGNADSDADELAVFPAFLAVPVSEVLVLFGSVDVGAGVRFSILPAPTSTPWSGLAEAFEGAVSVTRDGSDDEEWESAVGASDFLYQECRASGMSVSTGARRARLGVTSAEVDDCTGNRRVVGFGLDGADGTYAGAHDDAGTDAPAFTFVYVR